MLTGPYPWILAFGITGLVIIIVRWYQLCSMADISGDECTTLIFKDPAYILGLIFILIFILTLSWTLYDEYRRRNLLKFNI